MMQVENLLFFQVDNRVSMLFEEIQQQKMSGRDADVVLIEHQMQCYEKRKTTVSTSNTHTVGM